MARLVGSEPAFDVAANYADNLCRWDGQSAGHYEVWFLTLNERASKRGFWFRYAIESPASPLSSVQTEDHSSPALVAGTQELKPRVSLWATVFDRVMPENNFALKRDYEIDSFAFDGGESFSLKLGDGLFSASRATGRIEDGDHSIAWDLRFTPNEKTYHHITRSIIQIARPSSFVCSPNLDTQFSGTITLDGQEIELKDEPGCQSHLWGRKHVDEWIWVHSNAFQDHPGTVFEGLAGRPRRAGRTLPPLQSLFLRHEGEEHHFVRIRLAEQWRRNLGIGFWSFFAMNRRIYIKGVAQCRLRDMLQVAYCDPDGEPLYCVNSEVANLKIRIFRRVHGIRWRHVETIKAQGTTHLEHACRVADPTVRLAIKG